MKIQSHIPVVATLAAVFALPFASRAEDKAPAFKSADEIVKQIRVEGRVAFEEKSLPFKFDSTELASESAYRQLVEIAKALQSRELKGARFLIEGHTCDLGSEEYNLGLSKRRAAAVRTLLKRAGVDSDRLETGGRGEAAPAVPNSSESNRAKNRRVEIKKIS